MTFCHPPVNAPVSSSTTLHLEAPPPNTIDEWYPTPYPLPSLAMATPSTPSLPLDAPLPSRQAARAQSSKRKQPTLLAIDGGRSAIGGTGRGMGSDGSDREGGIDRQAGPRLSGDHPPSRNLQIFDLSVPIRTVNALNAREHPMARSSRVKRERIATAWALRADRIQPRLPVVVTLTRLGPTRGLDPGDNLAAALKGVRDAIASWLGVNDADETLVRYRYAQKHDRHWSVGIRIREVAQ